MPIYKLVELKYNTIKEDAVMKNNSVTLEIKINDKIDAIWEKWNNPKHIMQWYFASDDWHVPKAENDLNIGKQLMIRMEAKDGSFGFDYVGIYKEIIFHQLIRYQLGDHREVLINFKEENEMTIIHEEFDVEDENTIELQRQGWQAILNNFKIYCEKSK